MSNDNRVRFFDTTLRDGEQSPGASMNAAEKLRLAMQLEKLGVDAWFGSVFDGAPGRIDVFFIGACQTGDFGPFQFSRNLGDGLKITG